MENLYIILIGILFIAAISDLIVGVSNDAVNFLNSAIGSKAAPFKMIMIIASLGVIVGAVFSDGMMEVARKGIFHPEHFYFSEIMIIFLAVMLTDVILLDLFNTLGLPTSTTVSIVFELLGAAVAMSIIKVYKLGLDISEIGMYINSEKALAIIFGILLSIVIAFTAGALVQYLIRILFSFNFAKTHKYFGALWGGLAITAITYFLLIKGAKGSAIINSEQLSWIKSHTFQIIAYGFFGCTIMLQILYWLFKVDILKITVLLGTFALAMAFAGNDLINFIGVPLAGLKSFQFFTASGISNPDGFLMADLTGKVKTESFLLVLAGLVMVVTLWFSKKARKVTATTLDLSRQEEGDERFGASLFSRTIVRASIGLNESFEAITPKKLRRVIDRRFDQSFYKNSNDQGTTAVSFDMVRASVNLVVASILIAFATSLKLPLSTTYVTFMVAMGTSLADRAWGRESAVYRVSGAITVIGGWFMTAFIAFTSAFLMVYIMNFGGFIAIGLLAIVAIIFVYRTHVIFNKKEKEKQKDQELVDELKTDEEKILLSCKNNVIKTINGSLEILEKCYNGLYNENRKALRKILKDVEKLNTNTKKLKDNMHKTIVKFREDRVESGHYYVQVLDYLREIVHSVSFIARPIFDHVENNHKAMVKIQKEELTGLYEGVRNLLQKTESIIEKQNFKKIDNILEEQQKMLDLIEVLRKNQIKRIKKDSAGTKISILYLNIIAESKNLILYSVNLLKSFRDFVLLDSDEIK